MSQEHIRRLLAKGDLERALGLLRNEFGSAQDDQSVDDITVMLSQLEELQRGAALGTLTEADQASRRGRLTQGALYLARRLARPDSSAAKANPSGLRHSVQPLEEASPSEAGYKYDLAISFAGPERQLAERLAEIVSGAGFSVFYDDFLPEQLWGKDLVAFLDAIYRKDSRYCAMFLSREYASRVWTTHERRSATARLLAERGGEYILPVRVDDVEIDGLPPNLGYLSLHTMTIERIADILVRKLRDKAD